MVYAHFAPEYSQDAITLTPLRDGLNAESVHTIVVLCAAKTRIAPLKARAVSRRNLPYTGLFFACSPDKHI